LLNWRVAKLDTPPVPDCLLRRVEICQVARGSGPSMILVGDSNARMWIPTFKAIAQRESLSLSIAVYPGCAWQRGLQYATAVPVIRHCEAEQADWYDRVIPRFAPDVIVLAQGPYDDPAGPNRFVDSNGRAIDSSAVGFERLLRTRSAESLRALEEQGRKIVIIEPTPRPSGNFDPLVCLSEGKPAEQCRYTANRVATPLEVFYRSLESPNLVTLDLDRVVCPRLPTCDPIIDNIIVKRDDTHITATFARSRSVQVDQLLHSRGILAVGK
jgi:hypothetical protein